MIVLRRMIAIPFFITFFCMLMGLFFFSTIYRMKNPDVYAKQVQKAGAYDYISKELSVLLVKRMEEQGQDVAIQGFVKSIFNETFSASWVQKIIEDDLMKPFWPYIYGSVDHYTISIPVKDRFIVLLKSIKNQLLNGENSQSLYPTLVATMSTEFVKNVSEDEENGLRFLAKENETLEQTFARLLRTACPENELRTVLDSNLDKLINFIDNKNNERCILSFDFSKPLSQILQQVQISLNDPRSSKKIIQQLFIPTLAKEKYPFDIQINTEDADFILQKMSLSWMKQENEKIFENLQAYFQKRSEGFSVDLQNYKTRIISTFAALLEKKLREKWLSLPQGTPEQTEELMQSIYQGELPSHRPYAMSFEKMLEETGLDIEQIINNSVNSNRDEKTTFTHQDLIDNIPQNLSEFMSWENNHPLRVLKIDITNAIDSSEFDKIFNQQQLTFTEKNLHADRELEKIRSFLKNLPIVMLVFLVISGIILLIVANLCAQEQSQKIIWFLALAIAASMLVIMVTKTFDNVVWPQVIEKIEKEQQEKRFNNPMDKASQELGKYFLIALKDTFTSSMRLFSIVMIVLGVLLIFTMPIFRALLKNNQQQTFYDTNDGLRQDPPQT
ncbi:hypothetical protein [Candidatus Uabimicrobium amorphum]|uniref:Uncharacterized protein n=1 Tax=Uabimicrobium amorphum TaxID=2596890 RepID=A0A5S9F616_UABAM|nr:hypothetical protein [Candidatus Uabimicrobium amorphum]BBM87426.1 hypothetical protein UABAM_05835 [Candidatus Uabimicrobium amorphum]